MPKQRCLQFDTLDDRRELHHLLERLQPRHRLRFLAWACRQVTLPSSGIHPVVSRRSTGLAMEVYYDLWYLAIQHNLDLDAATSRLVEMVRQRG